MSNGSLLSAYSQSDLDSLTAKGYIIPQKYPGYSGVYFNDSFTCTSLSDDFCYIENNRTINKAIRLVYLALVPEIHKPVPVDQASGKLSVGSIKFFESLGVQALDAMVRQQEVSGFDVFVDPDQNVLATSEVAVDLEIVPVGTARTIRARIGFVNPFN